MGLKTIFYEFIHENFLRNLKPKIRSMESAENFIDFYRGQLYIFFFICRKIQITFLRV